MGVSEMAVCMCLRALVNGYDFCQNFHQGFWLDG